jgi:hypothetical protein
VSYLLERGISGERRAGDFREDREGGFYSFTSLHSGAREADIMNTIG